MELKGKTALVTGGAVRIGRAIAEELASQGVNIVVHFLQSVREAGELVDRIEGLGVVAGMVQTDLTSESACQEVIKKASAVTGSLDILINNASVFLPDSVHSADADRMQMQFRINLLAPLLLTRAFADVCDRGKIVNLLDKRISAIDLEYLSYSLSKMALAEATRAAALELAPAITVNAVAPGAILTPSSSRTAGQPVLAGSVPLDRQCQVSEVVDAVLFLLRNDALTGQVIYVDGGQHLS